MWSEDDDEVTNKPEIFRKTCGALVTFECKGLECNTLYEFRVSCANSVGSSDFSIPSIRAKTRKDSAPGVGRPPILQEVGVGSVTLALDVPPEGGGPIEIFLVDIRDTEKDIIHTRQLKFENGNSIFKLSGLRDGGLLQFRSRAVNRIGEGLPTAWTGELRLPTIENGDFLLRSSVDTKSTSSSKTASFRSSFLQDEGASSSISINLPPQSTKN